MDNLYTAPENKKPVYLLIIAGFILVAIGICMYIFGWNFKAPVVSTNTVMPKGTITILPKGELSTDLPSDIALDKDAVILSSYTGKTPDGKSQSTLVYTTKLKERDIYSMYAKYLISNGWKIKTGITFNGEWAIKDTGVMTVSVITAAGSTGTTTNVSINLIK